MAAKTIISDLGQTALTIYAVIQNPSGNYYDDADGTFKSSPTTPEVSLTEDSLIIGRYANRNVGVVVPWSDGTYSTAIFEQTGISADPTYDNLVGSGEIYIKNDVEINIHSLALETSLDAIVTANNNMLQSLIRPVLFEYKGDASNTFSISSGSFTGSIKFYTIDLADFIADPTNPSFVNQICTLTSDDEMEDVDDLDTDGEVILFTLVGFQALEDVIISYYNNVTKATSRFYVPKYSETVATANPYYPTVFGTLLTDIAGGSLVSPLTDIYANKKVSGLSDIDFDRLSQPIVVSQNEPIIIE